MGILTPRKRALAIRNVRDIFLCANKACQRKLLPLILNRYLCSCPICKSMNFVIKNGSDKGIPQFYCTNHEEKIKFFTTTSYEALEVYRGTMVEYLSQFSAFNTEVNSAVTYNEMSKYFTELALERFNEYIKEEGNAKIKINDSKHITLFFDISGSGLIKNKAIIMAVVNGEIVFDVIAASNYLTAHQFLASIKEKLDVDSEKQISVVSDGEICFVDSVREFFPNAIHIRQFHGENCKGIIYVHLNHERKLYTIRFLWNIVLNEGEPSAETKKMRVYKAKKRENYKPRNKKEVQYTELCKDVVIWEGTVYFPRGCRRKITKKKKKREANTSKEKVANKSSKKYEDDITVPGDTQKLIFRGNLESAMQFSVMKKCFNCVKDIFAGRYITSNIIEGKFNVKTKLYPHRTMKYGTRVLNTVLYSQFLLKNKSKTDLNNFFKEKVITYEFLQKKVLYGTGVQKNRIKDKCEEMLEKIQKAIEEGKELVLHYCDRLRRQTSRIVKPQKLEKNEYNGIYALHAYCQKRKEKRTFLLHRIRDLDIFDPTPCYFPSPPNR